MSGVTPEVTLNQTQQVFPLTLSHVLRRMRGVHGTSVVVTQTDETGSRKTATFAEVGDRVDRLASALRALGVDPGDRVGTLAWNSQEHLEAYYAIPCLGAVLHTINLRLAPDQMAYTIRHAGDRVVIVDDSLVSGLLEVIDQLDCVEYFVVVGNGDIGTLPRAVRYDDLLSSSEPLTEWPDLNELADAALCYTSGTTGNPKGIAYSHRTLVIHSLTMSAFDSYRASERDRLLAAVPMFHAMGWNLPYVAGLIGADLIMPRTYLQAPHLVRLIEEEKVTGSSGVPTVWMDVLRYADQNHSDLSTLNTVICGGTQVPPSLMRDYEERHSVDLVQGWGMTEVLPGAAIAHDPVDAQGDERWTHRAMAGRVSPFYEVRVRDDVGKVLPSDGEAVGEIEIRGAVVASEYYKNPEATAERFDDGWLKTGDVGTVDTQGWIKITDRAKDVIKSGGEWISSADLESELMAHPLVLEAAVIGTPDARWSERPLACVVTSEPIESKDLTAFLSGRVAKWWLPDEYVFLDSLPRTGTGKFDKRALRDRMTRNELPERARG